MEFKGTKGKWEIMKAYQMAIPFIVYSNEETIFQCYNTNGNDDAKANAQLISKAPEMLEMLKWFADEFDSLFHEGTESDTKVKEAQQLIKEATTI